MNATPEPALSILIPTRDRAESLRLTLEALAADRTEHAFEVVVIDNGNQPTLDLDSLVVPTLPSLRLLHDPRPGKAHPMNCALDAGGLAPLVAVLDDDMTPATDWVDGVLAASERLPEFDIFSGRSHAIWPGGTTPPAWADTFVLGMAFSVADLDAERDVEFGVGPVPAPSGNQFWFRRTVLRAGMRFPDAWPPEFHFVMALRAAGHRGTFVPGVVAGHRVQPELIGLGELRKRSARLGREIARLEFVLPDPAVLGGPPRMSRWRQAARATLAVGAWSIRWARASLSPAATRPGTRARAIIGLATNRERLALAFAPERARLLREWMSSTSQPMSGAAAQLRNEESHYGNGASEFAR